MRVVMVVSNWLTKVRLDVFLRADAHPSCDLPCAKVLCSKQAYTTEYESLGTDSLVICATAQSSTVRATRQASTNAS